MADLTTTFLGLSLPSPLIVGSSGLNDSVEKLKTHEKHGAGAVILKSIFEEEIYLESDFRHQQAEKNPFVYTDLSETLDYLDVIIKKDNLTKYLNFIKDAKDQCMIPIIASINCNSGGEWVNFAKKIEEAGADAIELNIFTPPVQVGLSALEIQENLLNTVDHVLKTVKTPVLIKISPYFSNLMDIVNQLKKSKAKGITLFNRFYHPDIDIKKQEITSSNQYTSAGDYSSTLKWIGIAADETTDFSASTGIHSGETIIKMLLAGAKTVQVVSEIYQMGNSRISEMLKDLNDFMDINNYNGIEQFRGKLSMKNEPNSIAYERMQFMKNFSGIK